LPFTRKLNFAQRLSYFAMTATYLDGWQKLIFYSAPVIVLFSNVPPLWANPAAFAAFFLPYFLLAIVYFEEFGQRYNPILRTEKFAMSRFAYAMLATLGVFRKHIKFRVSSKRLLGEFPLALLSPHIAVFTLSLAGIVYAAVRAAFAPQDGAPESLVWFVSLWALINMMLAGAVVRDAIRSARRGGSDYRFEIPLPVKIYGPDIGWRYGTAKNICSSEMSFVAHFPASPDVNSPLKGEIFLPNGALNFWSVVKSSKPISNDGAERNFLVECTLLWNKQSSADELDLTLISCKWHRRILNKREAIPTLAESLNRLFRASTAVGHTEPAWHPILYRLEASEQRTLRFGMIGEGNRKDRIIEFMFFEQLEPGSRVTILNYEEPDAPKLDYIVLSVETQDAGEHGLPLVNVTRHLALPTRQPNQVNLISGGLQWDSHVALSN